MDFSPPIVIRHINVGGKSLAVVRDDLLQGGTKQRAAVPFLKHLQKQGCEMVIYASPFAGYAQVALAHASKIAEMECLIVAEIDDTKNGMSYYSQIASQFCKVVVFKSLESAEKIARNFAADKEMRGKKCAKVPLGFDDPVFKEILKSELSKQWGILCDSLGYVPECLWLPVGSGTLADTFHSIVPFTVKIKCVDVGVIGGNECINRLKAYVNVEYIKAPEKFADPAERRPPVPSNPFYDAKLWQFIEQQIGNKHVWWNVA